MTIREIRQFVLSCNHSDTLAGMCKAQLPVQSHSESGARLEAADAGWESVVLIDRCAAHKSKPERSCPVDGTRLRVLGGVRTCHQGHKSVRGEMVMPV